MKDIKTLKVSAKDFYFENIAGKSIVNKDTGITVLFSKNGIRHLLNYKRNNFPQLELVFDLMKAVRDAKFSNFKNKDANELKEVIGYMNFNYAKMIDNKKETFRINIRITKDGKFYYHHSLTTKKKS